MGCGAAKKYEESPEDQKIDIYRPASPLDHLYKKKMIIDMSAQAPQTGMRSLSQLSQGEAAGMRGLSKMSRLSNKSVTSRAFSEYHLARGVSDPELRGETHLMRGEDLPYWASDLARNVPDGDLKIPKHGLPARFCLQQIEDHHVLDFSERLNTSSYVNVVFEPEEEQVALMGMRINLADQTVYPRSFKLHNDVVNMIAKLWKCPKPADFDEMECYAGAGTVGSTEACLLAGLAMKFRWRKWYMEKYNMDEDQVRGVYPNMIISTQFQACWEKFYKYFDVQPRIIGVSIKDFKLTGELLKGQIDDRTIGVIGILGNHYGGQYDPIKELNDVVTEINNEKGYCVGIHVDAASGGFVAPFQEVPVWDFRLKNVLSISASGHKFGNSVCGTGWIVWRQKEGLSEHVAINVSYLGGSADSYTLNFSRPAQGVFVQYYKFLRYGMDGYRRLCENQTTIAAYIRHAMCQMEYNGVKRFVILDDAKPPPATSEPCLPVVTAMLNPELQLPYNDIDLQHTLYQEHWYVSGYKMTYHHPLTHKELPLFTDLPKEQTMFRIVVKSNLTMESAMHLSQAIETSVEYLDTHAEGFKQRLPTILGSKVGTAGAC